MKRINNPTEPEAADLYWSEQTQLYWGFLEGRTVSYDPDTEALKSHPELDQCGKIS